MEKRVSALILIVLLSSTLSIPENPSQPGEGTGGELYPEVTSCLLYTSDAADE